MAEDKPQQAAGDDYTCIKDNKEKASGNLLHSECRSPASLTVSLALIGEVEGSAQDTYGVCS